MSALPAGGKPTRRKRTRKPTQADLHNMYAEAVEAVAARDRQIAARDRQIAERDGQITELEDLLAGCYQGRAELVAVLKQCIPLIERGGELEKKVLALTQSAERPGAVLARKRKGTVSEKPPYRAAILAADEQVRRDIAMSDDPAGAAMAYLEAEGIPYPKRKQTISRWLEKIPLIKRPPL